MDLFFTCICLAVCAIHLEWVKNSTPEQFLSCLRRYIARRGKPQLIIIISDDAPQFKVVKTAADRQKEKQLMLHEEVRHFITEGGIKWQFTTVLAPWQGSIYERLVELVNAHCKRALARNGLL